MPSPAATKRMPAIFIGHGSPGNVMEDNFFTRMWERLGKEIGKPRAIICVSAHWCTRGVRATGQIHPRTIHDFGGFPQEMYRMEYPAPGDPALAAELVRHLSPFDAEIDHEWGYDHGSWAVLKKIYPDADVPLIQLSMDIRKPHAWHYEVGKKLACFRDEGVLVMGSGNIVHNLPEMNWRMRDGSYDWAARFGDYIRESIASDEPEKLVDYESFGRDATFSVPSPDHYWPLLYVMGARAEGEPVHFETPVVEYGSLDMTTVVFGA